MADNYLENKMEDYRRGISSKVPRRSVSAATANPALSVPQQTIVLLITDTELLTALLQLYRDIPELKTAFAMTDYRHGSKLAQATGSLFVPVKAIDDAAFALLSDTVGNRWGAIDSVITDTPQAIIAAASSATAPCSRTIYYNFAQNYDLPIINNEQSVGNRLSTISVNVASHATDMATLAKLSLLLLTATAGHISSITLK